MAGSIKLFQFFQKFHRTIGIYPFQPNENNHSINSAKAFFLISLTQFMFTITAFLLFQAKSMFDYGFVFFLLLSITNTFAIYLIFVWQSENTLAFIGICEEFIEKRTHSTAAYNELIGKIELFTKLICVALFATTTLLLMVLPLSFARYYIFDMGEDSFYLFLPVWLPFDWKTPFGYLMAWLIQCAGCTPGACIFGQFLSLVLGSCWLFIFIADDITQDLIAFNSAAKTTSHENRTELTKRFRDMVQIYSNAKQCVMEFNHVFKYSLFSFFSYDMLTLSSLLVTIQFQLWADDSNLFETALLILLLVWNIVFVFFLCEPGARIIYQLQEFSEELNRCGWYLLPIELHRWYIIFLTDTQNPIKVFCFANITCERETSKKMINTAFSYFMTFRRFRS